MSKIQAKRKPRKFTAGAKTVTTALSLGALIGGWNLIGHLEATRNPTGNMSSGAAQFSKNTTGSTASPEIPPLAIAPVPTLPAVGENFTGSGAQASRQLPAPTPGTRFQLPSAPALAPLPALPAQPGLAFAPTNRRLRRRSGGS